MFNSYIFIISEFETIDLTAHHQVECLLEIRPQSIDTNDLDFGEVDAAIQDDLVCAINLMAVAV